MLNALAFLSPILAALPPEEPPDLAREARASASESQGDLTPGKALDGDPRSRWSGIPGHNWGVWFQLDFPRRIHAGEVVIHQYDRFVMELDIQARDPAAPGGWKTLRHEGRDGARLPRVVVSRFPPVETDGLRIAEITNGPSFTEVEVHAEPFSTPPVIRLASDLRGNFLGIVTDRWGSSGVEGVDVDLSGASRAGPWKASAVSEAGGMFSAAMPLGLEGTVRVEARLPAGGSPPPPAELAAEEFRQALTPPGGRTPVAHLEGKWRFFVDPPQSFTSPGFDDSEWKEIDVPSHWEMAGFHPPEGACGYRRRFELPGAPERPPASGDRLKLRFEGVYSGAEVWVNGRRVALHEGGFTPFEADITEATVTGSNVIAVRVTERTPTSEELDKMSLYADFPLGGIIRGVSLLRVPAAHLGSLHLRTVFDAEFRNARLEGRASVLNESGEPFRGALRLALADPAGRPVPLPAASFPVEAKPWGRTEVPFSIPVADPAKWDAEHPRLHRLEAFLTADGRASDTVTERIGFRQVDVRGPAFLVNGRPVKMRGTCHHDTHPLLGRAVTSELTRRDLSMMREANLNSVRTSHYPPHPVLPLLADELGLYVEDEAPFCWCDVSDDLKLAPHIIQLTAELIERDRNRASVLFWSLANESRFGAAFERSHDWVRAADPGRPTGAATSAWLEIATLHNPLAISRIDEHEKLELPLTFDESVAPYQGIFGDVAEMWVDPGIRDYYVEPFPAIMDRFLASKVTFGSMIWCWADDIFCVPGRGLEYGRSATRSHFIENQYRLPGRGLVGDAPWGVVDGWRRPKPEFWIVRKLHSPVMVSEEPLPLPPGPSADLGGAGPALRVPVANRFDFTDLSELEIAWSLGSEKGLAQAAVPPRSSGEIVVPLTRLPPPGESLFLEFRERGGRPIDAFRILLGEEPRHAAPLAAFPAAPLEVREESTLAGRAVRIIGKEFEVAFDRDVGLLRRGVAAGEALLLESPALHVMPTGRPLSPIPDRLLWKPGRLGVRRDGQDVVVEVEGSYPSFAGRYIYRVTPGGEVEAAGRFVYSGEDLRAKEVGLRFSVPRESDLLRWERKAEWRVYPPDHIGRPLGEARAFPEHGSALPPAWPWSEDSTPFGSNDFRSVKRHIHWASIGYPAGPAVTVESDGRQSARAIVESDRISLHVLDWYGGTGVQAWEWVHNYGEGRLIKKGERIEVSARLRFSR